MQAFEDFPGCLLIRLALGLDPDLRVALVEGSSLVIQVGQGLAGGSHNSAILHPMGQASFEFPHGKIQPDDPPQLLQMGHCRWVVYHASPRGDYVSGEIEGEDRLRLLVAERLQSLGIDDFLEATTPPLLDDLVRVQKGKGEGSSQASPHGALARAGHADQDKISVSDGFHGTDTAQMAP